MACQLNNGKMSEDKDNCYLVMVLAVVTNALSLLELSNLQSLCLYKKEIILPSPLKGKACLKVMWLLGQQNVMADLPLSNQNPHFCQRLNSRGSRLAMTNSIH